MTKEYKIAEELFNKGEYLQAFEVFKSIAINKTASDREISEVFNMMGVIVLIDTRVEHSDESGLEYFVKSLAYNPHNIGALLNIVEGFGLSINNHRDITVLDNALSMLEQIKYNYSAQEISMIREKKDIRDKLLNG